MKKRKKQRIIWAVVSEDNKLFIVGKRVSDIYARKGCITLCENEKWVKFIEADRKG